MHEFTRILSAIEQGDPRAAAQLLPLVYDELRKLAAGKLASERPDHTLQATALVHEAYLRLVADPGARDWNSRGHFFAAAAEAMRRILVENARHRASLKAGGAQRRVPLETVGATQPQAPTTDILALSDALDRLAAFAPLKAELVKLRYFAGLPQVEAAQSLGISHATADRYWAFARAWLYTELNDQPEEKPKNPPHP